MRYTSKINIFNKKSSSKEKDNTWLNLQNFLFLKWLVPYLRFFICDSLFFLKDRCNIYYKLKHCLKYVGFKLGILTQTTNLERLIYFQNVHSQTIGKPKFNSSR